MVAVRERGEHTRVWTATDLLAMPHDLDHRYELVEGRLVKMSPMGGTLAPQCPRFAMRPHS